MWSPIFDSSNGIATSKMCALPSDDSGLYELNPTI